MSLITRCPACSTMFKLVTDQLRVSGGWVRCGRCNEVFDAATHLLPYQESVQMARRQSMSSTPLSAEQSATAREAAPSDAAPAQPSVPARVGEEGASLQGDVTAPMPPESLDAEDAVLLSDPAPRPRASFLPWSASELQAWREARVAREGAAELVTPAAATDAPADVAEHAPPPSAPVEPELPETDHDPVGVDFVLSDMGKADAADPSEADTPQPEAGKLDVELSALSFVAAAKRRAFWSSRPMRATLWSVAVLLTLVLATQVVVSRRDALAARHPDWVPLLRTLCQPLACRIQPYRQLEAVVIDSSAFHRMNDSTFRFSVGLRNQQDMPIATPALELTLTDASEQPIARRVLSAAEIGAPLAIPARSEFSGTNTVTVSAPSDPAAVTGYRLVAFYP